MIKYSSDSDDDIPLIFKKHETLPEKSQLKTISYDSLQRLSLEKCGLCHMVFTSRYANIKHNATHITVPLVHRCDECLFHFSSLQELSTHIKDRNHKTSQLSVQPPNSEDGFYIEILKSIVKKQVMIKCHDIFSGILKDTNDSNKVAKNRSNNNIENPVRKPSPSCKVIKKNKEKSPERGFVPTFVISDSDSDSSELNPQGRSDLTMKQNNQETEQGYTEMEQDNQETEQDYSEMEQDNQETKQDYSEMEQDNAESDQSNPGREQWNQEREDRSERGQASPKLKKNDPGRVQNNIEEEQNEDSSFNFSSTEDLSTGYSPSRLSSPDYEPIKSRITFEDNFEDDDLFQAEEMLPDKLYPQELAHQNSYMSTQYIDTKKNSFIIGSHAVKSMYGNKPISHADKNSLMNESTVKNSVIEEIFAESVHYDLLVVPELCDCRYCGRCFCNRLELIKHEVTHIRLRRPRPVFCALCDRYLAGSYRSLGKHLQAQHPSYKGKKLQVQKCKICLFRYHNYARHVRHYHQLYECAICKRRYDKEELGTHDCSAPITTIDKLSFDKPKYKVLKMCDICLTLNKNRVDIHYEVIGEHCECGAKQQCARCHNNFFAVNLVKRKIANRDGPDIYKRKLPLSNKQRLKKIQNRLKMVNKMNKC